MFADGEVSSNGSGSFTFRNAGVVIGIWNAKGVPAGTEISKVTISGSNLSAATVSINGNAFVLTATEKDKDAISTETLSDITVATGETWALSEKILIAVPVGAKVEKVTLTVGEDTYSYTLAAAVYKTDIGTFLIVPQRSLPSTKWTITSTHDSSGLNKTMSVTYSLSSSACPFSALQWRCAHKSQCVSFHRFD